MAEILLVGLGESERAQLHGLAEHCRTLGSEECLSLTETDGLVGVVAGERAETILMGVQRLHRLAPQMRVAAVAPPEVLAPLRVLVRVAPDVPVDLELWGLPDATLADRVGALHRHATQAVVYERSLSGLGIDSTKAPPVVRATLDAVLEHAPVGVLIVDRGHRLLTWNPAAADLLHLQSRASGEPVSRAFLTPDMVTLLVDHAFAGPSSGPGPVETAAGPDGTFLDVSAAPTHLADGRVAVLVLVQDATARHRAEEARDRLSAQVRTLGGISEALLGATDEEDAVRRVTRQVVPTLADWVEFQVYDERQATQRVMAHHRDGGMAELTRLVEQSMPHGMSENSPSRQIARGAGPILLREITPEMLARFISDDSLRRLLVDLGTSSGIAVPLPGRAALLGSMVLVTQDGSPPLGDQEMSLAVEIGRRVGTALETLQLQRRQRALAEALQRSMLTDPPRPKGAQIEVRYRPAADEAQVGGDWYDSFLQPDDAIVLTVGDVMGHDFRAAAAMGQLRGLLRGIAYATEQSPAEILTSLDAAVDGLLAGTTATAIVAEVFPAEAEGRPRELVWSNAGHPPPLVRRAAGPVEVLTAESGADLLLGVLPDTARHQTQVRLMPGDTLVLYSDGLVEQRGKDVDEGIDELGDHLRALGDLPLGVLCDAVLDRMLPEHQEDDVALVAIRLDP